MDTQSLLSARTGPEGVRVLLGSTPVRRTVRSALAGMLEEPAALGRCRLHRTKFKPGQKLTAWFDAGLTARPSRPIAVSWWAAGTLPNPSPDDAAAEAEARRRGCATPFAVLGADVPDAQMRVHVAPLDPAYRGLTPMSDPAHVASVLGLGQPPRIVPLRYRPGQRHVLRYEPVDGAGPTLFVKLYADDRGTRLARAAATVAEILGEGSDGVAAVPVAALEAERALVFERAPGLPLRALLHRQDRRTGVALRQAGALLRRIHDAAPADEGPALGRSVDDELAEVTSATRAVAQLAPTLGALVGDVLARTQEALAAAPAEPAALVHGDFKTDHLLVGRRTLTLIDVDKCAVADPALDLAKFLADLRWWLRGDPAAAAAQGAFLAGYGPATAGREVRARALEPLFMVKLTARRVQVHQPRWASRTAGPIEQADHLLRGMAAA